MSFSAFDVIGPAMVGPSSSHTAGAVRIGLVARALSGAPPVRARIELHGSFAATGKGHATDRALVAGLLGFTPDDENLKDSLTLAPARGLEFVFAEIDLGEDVHPNTARLTVTAEGGQEHIVTGSSTGGGMIQVVGLDGFATSFGGNLETLAIWHQDRPGFLSKITTLLSCLEANIATIRTSRQSRGTDALTVIEIDSPLTEESLALLRKISATTRLCYLSRLP